MRMKVLVRGMARRAIQRVAGLTLFSRVRRVRSLGFDAFGASQSLMICQWPTKETFVVSTRDEIIGRELFLSGEFDFTKFVNALAAIRRHLPERRPSVLVDVGANIGTICIPAVARRYVERAIAVEPDPQNCRMLRANVELNDLASRISVREAAASAIEGESLVLELSEFNMGDHRIRAGEPQEASGNGSRRTVTVRSSTLDTMCAGEVLDDLLLWMDVQGFEGFALAGGARLLQGHVPLVLEFWPYGLSRTGSFHLVKSALAHYGAFVDLHDATRVRPISDLQLLFEEIGLGADDTTDILVFQPG